MKVLIVYHSHTAGNTGKLAHALAKGAIAQLAESAKESEVILANPDRGYRLHQWNTVNSVRQDLG